MTWGPTEEVNAVRERLPELTAQVESLLKKSKKIRSSDPTQMQLTDLESGWSDTRAALEELQGVLGRRADQIQDVMEDIQGQQETWKVTRDSLVATDVDASVLAQIDDVEQAIQKALAQAKEAPDGRAQSTEQRCQAQ